MEPEWGHGSVCPSVFKSDRHFLPATVSFFPLSLYKWDKVHCAELRGWVRALASSPLRGRVLECLLGQGQAASPGSQWEMVTCLSFHKVARVLEVAGFCVLCFNEDAVFINIKDKLDSQPQQAGHELLHSPAIHWSCAEPHTGSSAK